MPDEEIDKRTHSGRQILAPLICDVDGEFRQVPFFKYWNQSAGDHIVIDYVVGLNEDAESLQGCCPQNLPIVGLEQASDLDDLRFVIACEMQLVRFISVRVKQQLMVR